MTSIYNSRHAVTPEDIAQMKRIIRVCEGPTTNKIDDTRSSIVSQLHDFMNLLTIDDAETFAREIRRLMDEAIENRRQSIALELSNTPVAMFKKMQELDLLKRNRSLTIVSDEKDPSLFPECKDYLTEDQAMSSLVTERDAILSSLSNPAILSKNESIVSLTLKLSDICNKIRLLDSQKKS